MEDTGKARQLLQVVAASAKEKDMAQLTDKTHAEHFKKRKDDIDHLHRELKSELRMVESEVSRKLRRHFTHADIKSASGFEFLFDPETLAADLADILAGTLPDMLLDAGQDVYEPFLPPPDEAKAFITDRQNLMSNVAQETFDSVKAELQDGLDKGESYRELSKRLSSKFDEINEGRAQTVASTEVASAYGYARHEAMKQSGAKYKLWVGSGRPPGTLHGMRPAHAAAHYEGQTVAIDEPFRVGGAKLMFPTDSSLGAGPELTINCHCVALPAEGPIKSGDLPGHEFHGNQWTAITGPGAALGMGNRQEFLKTPKGRYQVHALAGEHRGKFALNLVKPDGTSEHIGIFKNITEAKKAATDHASTDHH